MVLPGLDLRDGVEGLVGYADADLALLWAEVDDATSLRAALNDVLPALIDTYGTAAASLAADWYDDQRELAGVAGRFTAIPADIPDSGAHALVGWATSKATDSTALRSLVLGGLQRRVANFSRLTVTRSALADPAAVGWQRVGSGACTSGFCDMLIGRGAVYSEATADFAAHDNCKCSAVPAWGGRPVPVKAYTPTLRNVSDADRERVRDWISVNL